MAVAHEGCVEAEEGVRLYSRTVGEGEAVLIPLVCWMEELDVLAKGRRVIFYDPRNRGQSTAVESERISLQNDVRDLEEMRRYFGFEKNAALASLPEQMTLPRPQLYIADASSGTSLCELLRSLELQQLVEESNNPAHVTGDPPHAPSSQKAIEHQKNHE